MEFTYEHKRTLSDTRHTVDNHSFFDDIVPPSLTEVLQAVAAELSPLPPVYVPLRIDDLAVYGWPADGVTEKIRAAGGSIQFGWRIREWPGILLTAEPHAVWLDPDGTLIDITPDVAGGDTSLFVPLPDDSDRFGADQPRIRYRMLYSGPDWSEAVAERIARMKSGQRAYEDRRAQKAGMTLEEWTREKYHHDPLPQLIDAFIEACEVFNARLPGLPALIVPDPDAADPEESPPLSDLEGGSEALVAPPEATDTSDEMTAVEPKPTSDVEAVPPDVVEGEVMDNEWDDDDEIYDDAEPFDVTWLAADCLDRWSRKRDAVRMEILRMMAAE